NSFDFAPASHTSRATCTGHCLRNQAIKPWDTTLVLCRHEARCTTEESYATVGISAWPWCGSMRRGVSLSARPFSRQPRPDLARTWRWPALCERRALYRMGAWLAVGTGPVPRPGTGRLYPGGLHRPAIRPGLP